MRVVYPIINKLYNPNINLWFTSFSWSLYNLGLFKYLLLSVAMLKHPSAGLYTLVLFKYLLLSVMNSHGLFSTTILLFFFHTLYTPKLYFCFICILCHIKDPFRKSEDLTLLRWSTVAWSSSNAEENLPHWHVLAIQMVKLQNHGADISSTACDWI